MFDLKEYLQYERNLIRKNDKTKEERKQSKRIKQGERLVSCYRSKHVQTVLEHILVNTSCHWRIV